MVQDQFHTCQNKYHSELPERPIGAPWKGDGCVCGTRVRISHSLPGVVMLKNFEIDERYLCDESVPIYRENLENRDSPTQEDMMKIIKGTDRTLVGMSNRDHPVFAELRDRLEQQGYIITVRNSWNGDRVIKSFKLNGWTFCRGNKFPCAAALYISISCARKHGWTSISSY
jgi:hypothetical protein